jgi:hypothetical protein
VPRTSILQTSSHIFQSPLQRLKSHLSQTSHSNFPSPVSEPPSTDANRECPPTRQPPFFLLRAPHRPEFSPLTSPLYSPPEIPLRDPITINRFSRNSIFTLKQSSFFRCCAFRAPRSAPRAPRRHASVAPPKRKADHIFRPALNFERPFSYNF